MALIRGSNDPTRSPAGNQPTSYSGGPVMTHGRQARAGPVDAGNGNDTVRAAGTTINPRRERDRTAVFVGSVDSIRSG